MSNIISCRTGLFGSPSEAFACFPEAGVQYAEVPPPEDGDYARIATAARKAGVTIATFATQLALDSDGATATFRPVIDGAASVEVGKIFISAKAGEETPHGDAIRRLRETAEYAGARGVTLCMETHPPFGTNGDVARQILTEVNHPALRYNFDTANIYYYNQGADAIGELRKVVDLAASVHLKDTDGGYRSGNFPPLGTGIVDFPAVFEILGRTGFSGPYTLEIEGALVGELDRDGKLAFLRECIDYLRQIGAME